MSNQPVIGKINALGPLTDAPRQTAADLGEASLMNLWQNYCDVKMERDALRAEVERLRSQFANSERERKLLRAELSVTEDACAMLEADVERLRAALESIAENTCCGTCQEAALVARTALSPGDGNG